MFHSIPDIFDMDPVKSRHALSDLGGILERLNENPEIFGHGRDGDALRDCSSAMVQGVGLIMEQDWDNAFDILGQATAAIFDHSSLQEFAGCQIFIEGLIRCGKNSSQKTSEGVVGEIEGPMVVVDKDPTPKIQEIVD